MNGLEMGLVAVALSLDSFAVALSASAASRRAPVLRLGLLVITFAATQTGLAFAGWRLGEGMAVWFERFGPWLAFALLAGVGMKMIHESLTSGRKEKKPPRDYLKFTVIILLALATSIDAFAVGISLALVEASRALSLVAIGTATAVLAGAGAGLGRRFGSVFGDRAGVAGGLVIVGIGVKMLLLHLF